MTTIVATMEVMGADTMVFSDSKGMMYPASKLRRLGKKGIVGAAGDGGDCVRFMDWAATGFDPKKKPKFSTGAGEEDESILLLLNEEGIHLMATSDPYPELIAKDYYAIGSGGKAAMGALAHGASIDEALEIASSIDPYTRPPFNLEKL